ESMFGTKIARTNAIGTAEQARHFFRGQSREFTPKFASFKTVAQRNANIAGERVVTGHAFVGPFQDDHVLFPAKSIDNRGFWEWTDDVNMERADLGIALLAEVIASGIDVFGGTTERNKDSLSVLGFVLAQQMIMPSG